MTGRDKNQVRHKTWKGCSEIVQDKRTPAGLWVSFLRNSVGDPDPHVSGPSGSGSVSQSRGTDPAMDPSLFS